MRDDKKQERHAQIATAAYELLATKGYAGSSMLAVAKRAKASNETLYRWYGSKSGLFSALIEDNARITRDLLSDHATRNADPRSTLDALGPALYALLTSERAIALNRAAAADPTGELGLAIGKAGRDTVGPMIGDLMVRAKDAGLITFDTIQQAVRAYLDILVGDHQIRRAIGTLSPPSSDEIKLRANMALEQFLVLFSPEVYPSWQTSTSPAVSTDDTRET